MINNCTLRQIININSLSIKYDDFYSLKNISFSLNQGDFIALIGSNGAGKSTLLNSLYGLLKPYEGSISYNPNYFDSRNPARSIGFSAQRCIMDWYLTVEDNVYLGALIAGIKPADLSAYTEQALSLVHLSAKAKSTVEALSGGQQQRVQIARAIVHKPKLYILDEPTTGLDPDLSENFFKYLKSEQRNGKTIIISSHDLFLLEKYCTKIIFLEQGQLAFFGTMDDFLRTSTCESLRSLFLKLKER